MAEEAPVQEFRAFGVEFICAECGETTKVSDVEAVLRALHLKNECEAVSSLLSAQE